MNQPITIIVRPESQLQTAGGLFRSCPRESYQVDRFREEVQRVTGCSIALIEGSLAQSPADGFLLIYESSPLEQLPALGPRTVLLRAARSEFWGRVAHRYGLAAAVEDMSAIEWERGNEGPGGLLGLVAVAERAGMAVGPLRAPLSPYGFLSCHGHCHNFAELLVHYLTVYEEMGLHNRPAPAR